MKNDDTLQDRNKKKSQKQFVNQIRQRHLAYNKKLLQEQNFCKLYPQLIDNFLDWLLQQKVTHYFPRKKVKDIIVRAVDELSTNKNTLGFVVESYLSTEIQRFRNSSTVIKDYLSPETLHQIDELLDAPTLLPRSIIEKCCDHKAFNQMIASLLYNALREFTIQVNPFFSSWGLPAILKKASPFGIIDPLGMSNKIIELVKNEFEKQLEPQIKNFLQLFTSTAQEHVISYIASEANQNVFTQYRKDLWADFSDYQCKDFMFEDESDLYEHMSKSLVSLCFDYFNHPEAKNTLLTNVDIFYSLYGRKKFKVLFNDMGFNVRDWSAELIELFLPLLVSYTQSDMFTEFTEKLIEKFYDEELKRIQDER